VGGDTHLTLVQGGFQKILHLSWELEDDQIQPKVEERLLLTWARPGGEREGRVRKPKPGGRKNK
jgi:hypothetical protein